MRRKAEDEAKKKIKKMRGLRGNHISTTQHSCTS